MIVSRKELANVLGISPIKLTNLVSNAILNPVAHGKYDLAECIQKYIEYSVEQLSKKVSGNENAEESLQYWKTQRQKHAALKEMGILIRTDDVEKLMSSRLGQIRNTLVAIDSTWAPYIIGLKTVEDAQKALSLQLDKLFIQLSSLQDFADLPEEDVPVETEDDEDDS